MQQAPAASAIRCTVAEVRLDLIAANVRALAALVRPARVLTVVKANAYGHGAVEVARAALSAGASALGVYTTGEGLELRRAGIGDPILVFGPYSAEEAGALIASGLTPTVAGERDAAVLQARSGSRSVPFHLKIDTGLTRAGVPHADASALLDRLPNYPALQPEGIYTHLACADDEDTSCASEQLTRFRAVCAAAAQRGLRFALRHAANSAGTLGLPEARFDLVRCGLATYGYAPAPHLRAAAPLQPALRLRSAVSRIVEIPPGTGVGYGHEFRAQRSTRIALVPIGYGDGLRRALGLGCGRVIVRGTLVPIVGRVSMDQITLDVTDTGPVEPGDEVTIIGTQGTVEQTADDLAGQMGTIGYEVLTGIMPRVPRLYTNGEDGR